MYTDEMGLGLGLGLGLGYGQDGECMITKRRRHTLLYIKMEVFPPTLAQQAIISIWVCVHGGGSPTPGGHHEVFVVHPCPVSRLASSVDPPAP